MERLTLAGMLGRVARLACPVCGKGRIFRRYFLRAHSCNHCRWRFERGEGHWVGGSEVHMFASYGLSVLLCIPLLIVLGPGPATFAGVIGLHVGVSLTLFRFSRALFLGLDYYLDPRVGGPGGDEPPPAAEGGRPRTPPTLARLRARRRERSSPRGAHRRAQTPGPA